MENLASPLTELPPTPRSSAVEVGQDEGGLVERKRTREKRQIVDSVTELQYDESRFTSLGTRLDAGDTVADHQFLHNSSVMLRLLEIHANPTAHFFHGRNKTHDSYNCDAPYGVGPELKQLFTRPAGRTSSGKRNLSPPSRSSSKRIRIESCENTSQLELGRRGGSPGASFRLGSELIEPSPDFDGKPTQMGHQPTHFDDDMDVQMNATELEAVAPLFRSLSKSPLRTETQPPSPCSGQKSAAGCIDMLTNEHCLLSTFNDGPPRPTQSQLPDGDQGFSKNTVKALEIIRNELLVSQPAEEEKVLRFGVISNKVNQP